MTPADLSAAVLATVRSAVERGDLSVDVPASVSVERPRNRDHGDYATNIALRLAKQAGTSPREVAAILATGLRAADGIESVDIAGPGFLNITLADDALGTIARTVVAAGSSYGNNETLTGQRINLEFVSANPTGPVHMGAVRWAAVGDALSRLLRASGAEVGTEYYFNDAGSQIERFSRTLREVANDRAVPEDGYGGEYVAEIAKAVLDRSPGVLEQSAESQQETFRRVGVDLMFAEIKSWLTDFGVHFDLYFNEKDLHDRGELDAALKRLRDQGNIYEADGAVWLRTSDYGDDRDRPVVRSDGTWTYFAADCAYYLDKRERGFDRIVIMLGADHHGYINRLRAMATCFGDDPDQTLQILIGQLVNLVKDGQPVRMSKRAGDLILGEDLVGVIGVDAARYALARYSSDQSIDLDLDAWTRKTSDNPVFYVQYAHARLSSLLRNAADIGATLGDASTVDYGLLSTDRETDLLRVLGDFPAVVASAAELDAPHRVARYLEDLAGTYHRFYDHNRVLPQGDEDSTPLTIARLWLCEATRVVLENGLGLLGVSAPERM